MSIEKETFMVKKVVIILNHEPTATQLNELKEKFKIEKVIFLNEELKTQLKNIPPSNNLPEKLLNNLISFLKNNLSTGDYIWIQTEYGVTFYIVDFAIKSGFIPIYSTTQRIYKERKLENGKIERNYIFEHVTFRRYVPYKLCKN